MTILLIQFILCIFNINTMNGFTILGGAVLNIIISNSSGKPIYEQITSQIKNLIISGKLLAGDALPSMRVLAKELRISVITTRRAYTDLEQEGFIETIPGKGSFVSSKDPQILREGNLRIAEEHLLQAVEIAQKSGITYEELESILSILFYGE